MKRSFYLRIGKRLIDFIVSTLLLLCFLPILLFVAILVRLKLGAPIFFRQQRPGLNGKPFIMYKFRTMTDGRDTEGKLLPDSVRLTTFGRFLRKSSLDELPELLNVVKGDMSLIGPRPLLMQYLNRYTPFQMRRHEAKPGITGWAQINGRNQLSWEEKFQLDVWYVENHSWWLDLKILYLTLVKVLRQEGVNQSETVTMEEFKGYVAQ